MAWHVIAVVCEQQCSEVAGSKPAPNTHSENYTCLYRHAHTQPLTHMHTLGLTQAAGGWASVWMTWPRFGGWVISTPHTHTRKRKEKKNEGMSLFGVFSNKLTSHFHRSSIFVSHSPSLPCRMLVARLSFPSSTRLISDKSTSTWWMWRIMNFKCEWDATVCCL